jgi:hypothetical protein
VHGQQPTEVVLRVRGARRDHELARRLGENETLTTFVDGVAAGFGVLGIVPLEAHYPVVAQHGLQTFVHSKPKDRRDALCGALGLEDLIALKAALESARSSFQRTPPAAVMDARKRLNELARGLIRVASLARVAQRWSAMPPALEMPGDEQALITAAANLTGEPVTTTDGALAALRKERERAGRSVFDLTLIEPLSSHDALRNSAETEIGELTAAASVVDDRLSELAGVSAAAYGAALLSFWKDGLELAAPGDICPMCEAPTLTIARREALEQRLRAAQATIEADSALATALSAWEQAVAPAGKSIAALGLQGMDGAGKLRFAQLIGDSTDPVQFHGTPTTGATGYSLARRCPAL